MDTGDIGQRVIRCLNELGFNYMVVGSFATNFYCAPRSTQGVDLVIESDLVDVAKKISSANSDLRFDPQLGFESVTATTKALLISKIHAFHVELFGLSDHPYDRKRFERRIEAEIVGQKAWIATADDIVVTKMQWAEYAGREKDISDVRNVIAIQHEHLDWPYIEHWCGEYGTLAKLAELRAQLNV